MSISNDMMYNTFEKYINENNHIYFPLINLHEWISIYDYINQSPNLIAIPLKNDLYKPLIVGSESGKLIYNASFYNDETLFMTHKKDKLYYYSNYDITIEMSEYNSLLIFSTKVSHLPFDYKKFYNDSILKQMDGYHILNRIIMEKRYTLFNNEFNIYHPFYHIFKHYIEGKELKVVIVIPSYYQKQFLKLDSLFNEECSCHEYKNNYIYKIMKPPISSKKLSISQEKLQKLRKLTHYEFYIHSFPYYFKHTINNWFDISPYDELTPYSISTPTYTKVRKYVLFVSTYTLHPETTMKIIMDNQNLNLSYIELKIPRYMNIFNSSINKKWNKRYNRFRHFFKSLYQQKMFNLDDINPIHLKYMKNEDFKNPFIQYFHVKRFLYIISRYYSIHDTMIKNIYNYFCLNISDNISFKDLMNNYFWPYIVIQKYDIRYSMNVYINNLSYLNWTTYHIIRYYQHESEKNFIKTGIYNQCNKPLVKYVWELKSIL